MAFNCYMHERNIYRKRPDFAQIAVDFPVFRKFAIFDAKGRVRIDFSNPEALRILTEILLKKDFNLDIEVPQGFLIPTVPQRLNYILWIEDLLSNISHKNEKITGFDIGTGPCAIFPILGAQKNGWNFTATESSDDALQWAKINIQKNNLMNNISVVKVSPSSTLSEILSTNESCYEFCMCNPPFFENIEEIRRKHAHSSGTIADVAQKEEIFVKGGEVDFVKNLLRESALYKDRICLFTSMFGKKKSFLEILQETKKYEDAKVTTTEFCQGNTVRWGIAWTFDESIQFEEVTKKKIKNKSAKPPLKYEISMKKSENNLNKILNKAKKLLNELEIPFTVIKSSKSFAELLLKSDKNTWTHLRRKRRELERQKNSKKYLPENKLNSSNGCISPIKSDTNSISMASDENISSPSSTNRLSESSNPSHLDILNTDNKGTVAGHSEKDDKICNIDTINKPISLKMSAELEMNEIKLEHISDLVSLRNAENKSKMTQGEKKKRLFHS